MNIKTLQIGVPALVFTGVVGLGVLPAQAERIKESYRPVVNDSMVTLMEDNYLTQTLGGRMVDLDVWVGEFVKFDDNIFNTKNSQKEDTIFATATGIHLEVKQDDTWMLQSVGQIQYNLYDKYNEYDGFEGFINNKASVKFSPALSGNVKFNYSSVYDNIPNQEDIDKLQKFETGAGLSVQPSPFMGVDFDYTYFAQRRDKDLEKQEYDEHTITVRPSYSLTPNTTVYVQTGLGSIRPLHSEMTDVEQYSGAFGLAWAYKDTARMVAELGYRHMEFDGEANADDSHGGLMAHLSAEYGFTTDWTLGADFTYAPYYAGVSSSAINSNYVDRFNASTSLVYSPGAGRFTANLKPYYTSSQPNNNDDYHEYGVNLSASYVVTEWFNVNAGYTHAVTEYENESAYSRNTVTVGLAGTF